MIDFRKMDEIREEELSRHKISKIRTLKVRNRYHRLNGKNAFRGEHGYGEEFMVKEIFTDQGAKGWGLFVGRLCRVDQRADSLLIGRRVSDIFDTAKGVTEKEALEYDFALHDLAGNILNVPVFRMLGAEGSNPIACYDGAILMDDLSPDGKPGGLSKILEECRIDYGMGYRDFKIKIGRAPKWMGWKNGLKRDIEVTRMVRERYPKAKLMVDANSVYPLEKMLEYVKEVADCDLYWIEEPFVENRDANRRLRDFLNEYSPQTMIADGEAEPDVPFLLSLVEEGILDVIQMDIAGYGFTAWRQLLPMLAEKKVKISPHNWGLKLKTHYTAALGVAYTHMPTVEGVLDETEGVNFEEYYLYEGKMTVPDLPGFGMELEWGLEV